MGLFKHQPGCPCCCEVEDCELHSDDFSSDTIADYTQSAGTWSVSSGTVKTADANAVLLWSTEAGEQHSVSAILVPPSDTSKQDVFKIIVGWADSSNYLYARIRCNGSGGYLLSLREVISGSDAQIKAEIALTKNANDSGLVILGGTRILLSVCYDKTNSVLSYVADSLESGTSTDTAMVLVSGYAAISDTSGLGTYAGIGTGAVASVSVEFTKLWIYYADENCLHCFCNVCDMGTSPTSITVEFSGVVDDECANCDVFNTTAFVLTRRSNSCIYSLTRLWDVVDCGDGDATSPAESNWDSIDGRFFCGDYAKNTGGLFIIRVQYADRSTGTLVLKVVEFVLPLGCCKIDCTAVLTPDYYSTGVDIPFNGVFRSTTIATTIPACDWTNATATVTSVA